MDLGGQRHRVQDDSFIESGSFVGPREGYYFGTGSLGTGYYLSWGGEDAGQGRSIKRKRNDEDGDHRQMGGEELLELLERQSGRVVKEMDGAGLERLLRVLEKKFNANVERRIQYADEPQKFMESEVELDEAVKGLHVVTASANLYPHLATSETIPIFLSLIQHQNGDIAADMIDILSQLTEADAVENYEEEARVLIGALVDNGLMEVLIEALAKMDESNEEEAKAVYNILSVIENCIDVMPDVASTVAETTGMLEWLNGRVGPTFIVDSNTQYASEILAVLLQSGGEKARLKFGELGGVDTALRSIAPYRSKATQTPEEEEFVENVFDILCAVLMEDAGKRSFLDNEGIELMVLMLKGRTLSRTAALKCLDFATTKFIEACERCVKKGILPLLFGICMGKLKILQGDKKKIKRHLEVYEEEEEVRCVSIIANLFICLEDESSRDRLLAKFVESEYEKCDRVIEIMIKYAARVSSEEHRIESLFGEDDVDKDEMLLARMDAGLYTLQQCALIVAELWATKDYGLRKRILMLLHQYECTLSFIKGLLDEYLISLGPAETSADQDGLDNPKAHIARIHDCIKDLE